MESGLFKIRQCSRIPDDEESGDEVDGGEEGVAQFVVAGGDAPEVFHFVEEALDAIAPPVALLVVGWLLAARAYGRDDRLDAVEG